jgi:hypothetical protein
LPPITEALEEVKQGNCGNVESARTGQREKIRRYWDEDKAVGFGNLIQETVKVKAVVP